MSFFCHFESLSGTFVLLPTLVVTAGECACCGELGGYMLCLNFGPWEVGVGLTFGQRH